MKPTLLRAACRLLPVLCLAVQVPAASLYDEKTYHALISDSKAFRVGDVITVQIFENSSATSNADTTTRRKNNLSAQLSHGQGKFDSIGLGVGGDFDGGGQTQRVGRLLAQLSVSVREVYANGEMQVGGEQVLLINDERQRISIEGRVRPQDVSDGNVVQSTRLADAQIVYHGEGDLSSRQKRSWWRAVTDAFGF